MLEMKQTIYQIMLHIVKGNNKNIFMKTTKRIFKDSNLAY
jgi:hypothetical protein